MLIRLRLLIVLILSVFEVKCDGFRPAPVAVVASGLGCVVLRAVDGRSGMEGMAGVSGVSSGTSRSASTASLCD